MLGLILLNGEYKSGSNTALLFQASAEQTTVPIDFAKRDRVVARWDTYTAPTNDSPFTSGYSFSCGLGGYLLTAINKQDLVFTPEQDFTIEWFSKHTTFLEGSYLFGFEAVSTNSALYRTGGNLTLRDNAGNLAQIAISVLTFNVWHHIAIVGSGTTITLYIDGVARASISNRAGWSTSIADAVIMGRGGAGNSGGRAYCKMDQFRVSRLARYTGDFTPPTEPFTLD